MAQLSHWAGRYSDTLTEQTYHIELREDEFEDIVVLEISGRDTEPIDEWTGTGKVGHAFIHSVSQSFIGDARHAWRVCTSLCSLC